MKKTVLFFILGILILGFSITGCQKTVDTSAADITALKEAVNALQKRSDSLAAALTNTNNNLSALSKSIDSVKTQLAGIIVQINQLTTSLNTIGANITSINAQIAILNQQYADLLAKLNSILAQLTITPNTITNGLVAYYPFTGNAGDSSGNGNHGTVNGPSLTTDRFGNNNSAYLFLGKNNYIDLGTGGLSSNPNTFSISVWVYVDSIYTGLFQTTSAILSKRHADLGPSWSTIQITKDSLPAITVDGPGYNHEVSGGKNILNNKWNHIVGIKAGNRYDLYYNGIKINSVIDNYVHVGSALNLHAGHQGAWDDFFFGKIDDIRVYNRELNQSEITYLTTH